MVLVVVLVSKVPLVLVVLLVVKVQLEQPEQMALLVSKEVLGQPVIKDGKVLLV
jgi:hypothetical protein